MTAAARPAVMTDEVTGDEATGYRATRDDTTGRGGAEDHRTAVVAMAAA